MKNYVVLPITFLLFTVPLIAQFSHCDSLIGNSHHLPFDSKNIVYTYDYVKSYYPKYKRHVSSRDTLSEITCWINNSQKSLFLDYRMNNEKNDTTNSRIEIDYGSMRIDGSSFFSTVDSSEKYSRILLSDDAPFGITYLDTAVRTITKITVNSKKIPDKAFQDLYNPNICQTAMAIKPISAFYSDNKEYIYLYIFGELNENVLRIFGNPDAVNFSYMAKLIFTYNGEYIGRIVIRGNILEYFHFSDCPNFKGF